MKVILISFLLNTNINLTFLLKFHQLRIIKYCNFFIKRLYFLIGYQIMGENVKRYTNTCFKLKIDVDFFVEGFEFK